MVPRIVILNEGTRRVKVLIKLSIIASVKVNGLDLKVLQKFDELYFVNRFLLLLFQLKPGLLA